MNRMCTFMVTDTAVGLSRRHILEQLARMSAAAAASGDPQHAPKGGVSMVELTHMATNHENVTVLFADVVGGDWGVGLGVGGWGWVGGVVVGSGGLAFMGGWVMGCCVHVLFADGWVVAVLATRLQPSAQAGRAVNCPAPGQLEEPWVTLTLTHTHTHIQRARTHRSRSPQWPRRLHPLLSWRS